MSYAAGMCLRRALIGFLLLAASAVVSGQMVTPSLVTKPPTGFSREIILWPEGAPGALGRSEADIPKLFVFPAPSEPEISHRREPPRPAVIVLPGGGYRTLMSEKEGASEAHWLNAHGVMAFVLEYRLGPRYHFPAPMLDGARAIRYVRSHAAELGVDPRRIGLWGFSAGGHLAGYLATVHDAGNTRSADPIERVSDRPDFAILSYARLSMEPSIPRPTNLEALIGDHPSQEMLNAISIDRHVTPDTSPCFIFSTTADKQVNSLTATAFYDALKRAGVSAELHVFERGPHGIGLGEGYRDLPELAIFPTLVRSWMEIHDWMGEPAGPEPRRSFR